MTGRWVLYSDPAPGDDWHIGYIFGPRPEGLLTGWLYIQNPARGMTGRWVLYSDPAPGDGWHIGFIFRPRPEGLLMGWLYPEG